MRCTNCICCCMHLISTQSMTLALQLQFHLNSHWMIHQRFFVLFASNYFISLLRTSLEFVSVLLSTHELIAFNLSVFRHLIICSLTFFPIEGNITLGVQRWLPGCLAAWLPGWCALGLPFWLLILLCFLCISLAQVWATPTPAHTHMHTRTYIYI